MHRSRLGHPGAGAGALLLLAGAAGAADTPYAPDWNRDVKPILSEKCFACHGPDARARKAGLRLDVEKDAVRPRDGGRRAVEPGSSRTSLVIERIHETDPSAVMPPPETGKTLSAAEKETLRRWIDGGAVWKPHWSLIPPERPPLPRPSLEGWARNPVDLFILARIEKEALRPSPEASRARLLRRVTLDLTGLPPEPSELEAFLADTSGDAYEKVVDRLLASKHFGERMALDWLDLARFADSDGYHQDIHRSMWQYRDWVIRAFNEGKPFDTFTIEQIAGDLLPGATVEQKIATAFQRNTMSTTEAGADAEEYLSKYVVDRVSTTGTVWLGLTLGCAECHDHKYDPITQRDFYRLYDFYNQVPEKGLDADPAPPFLRVPSPAQSRELERISGRLAEVSAQLAAALAARGESTAPEQARWESDAIRPAPEPPWKAGPWSLVGPFPETGAGAIDTELPPEVRLDLKDTYENGALAWREEPAIKDGVVYRLPGEGGVYYFTRVFEGRSDRSDSMRHRLWIGAAGALKTWWNGSPIIARTEERWAPQAQEPVEVDVRPGENRLLVKVANRLEAASIYFAAHEHAADPELGGARKLLAKPAAERTAAEAAIVRRSFLGRRDPEVGGLDREIADLIEAKAALERSIPSIRVMEDMAEPRATHILVRGDYRAHGEPVTAGMPAAILPAEGPVGAGKKRLDRLDLARWLVHPRNPLVPRVLVNRWWQMLFGKGFVKASNDFGAQGDLPSHPELLDWLSVELVEKGWAVKPMLRMLVTSATYRQDSAWTPELLAKDPENRLLARMSRLRLPAETIRDSALAAAGLFDRSREPGGPSVRPYQPPRLWEDKGFQRYVQSRGADLYRRSLYVYRKRSVPSPLLTTFDAPSREVCTARRDATCTPLQAFVTLNETTYLEAARVLAERTIRDGGPDAGARIRLLFLRALSREPDADEARILISLAEDLRAAYEKDPAAGEALSSQGAWPRPRDLDPRDLAAWTAVASSVLNLDEMVTRE